jgi:hypothetical protein
LVQVFLRPLLSQPPAAHVATGQPGTSQRLPDPDREANEMRSAAVRSFVHDFPWFHRWMGLVGNALFVIGSVFFLFDRLVIAGTWIFVGASLGLLADSVGEKLRTREEELRGKSTKPA